ncbi:MAG: DUF2442 domain-containing protein [Pegethrix bostrychoides GSE-TBD4-15B]|jgi:hypothetical protein|uniref:DUF2442 domain-containing protein n=1 Tax=Pegethrix bostrychoides GSE-TBD4-15B TaxID=2839662 RepID=A0A951PC11_9CYAN|nr:DUF2442 domain-containing protein [Pegethrix bostrychoides GSE-TBD4-15B]
MAKFIEPKVDEYTIATIRGELNQLTHPVAIAATYQSETGLIEIIFSNQTRFCFPAHLGQGLAGATAEDLADIEITPSGTGLHWEALDVDLYIPALLEGTFGSRQWMTALAKKGGAAKSAAKTQSSRQNGKKGGRPRKATLKASS